MGDYSYGIYTLAHPLQMLLREFFGTVQPVLFFRTQHVRRAARCCAVLALPRATRLEVAATAIVATNCCDELLRRLGGALPS